MSSSRAGFTLIELMIVVAIIAIIAAIAIPNLLSARLNANETAAIATLRNISSAEAQFQATSKADTDQDGTGEFGSFREMSGAWDVRGDANVGIMNPPVLSGAFRTVVSTGDGAVSRSGYFFKMLLPQGNGTGICVDDDPADFASVDADLAETTWCCYAWPVNYGNSGNRTFCVNQSGDIITTEDRTYSGPIPATWTAGAAFLTSVADSITSRLAVGTAGNDGNLWKQVN
jgi:prepilin-type N-terminal cleavage/methylation domain-containing protein